MKDIRDRIRAKWANTVLNLAESLPTFNAGVVAHLQQTRKHQRERSDREFEQSRLPEGRQVKLCGFNLVRPYSLEDLGSMDLLMRRWFPRAWEERGRSTGGDAERLTGVSWSYIGHIARRGSGLFPGEVAVLDDLPPDLERISVGTQMVLPSLRVLSFGVTLSEEVSTRMLQLYKSRYLGRITFNSWLPHRSHFWGRSEGSPDAARQIAMYEFIEGIRSKAKKFITRHFPGPSYWDQDHFVALDEFHLTKGQPGPDDSSARVAWGWQFGFRAIGYNSFRSDLATLLSPNEESGLSYPHRLIINGDPQPGEIINASIDNTVRDLVPFLSMLDLLEDSEGSVGRLRLQVFKKMADRGLPGWFWRSAPGSFSREIRLNSALQIHRMLVERLGLEYRQHKEFYDSWCRELKVFVSADNRGLNLLDTLQKAISRKLDLVSKHLQLASESFSAHVSARNLDVTYRLGRKVFVLTLIVTFATALGILGNWPAILSGLKSVRQYLVK